MRGKQLQRVFRYNGQDLPDLNKDWDADRIRKNYASEYPALTNATIKGPELDETETKAIYTFQTSVGTKG